MKRSATGTRRPAVHITLARASRLYRMIGFLNERPRARDSVLLKLEIGLRTFYRELELLDRCGVKVRHKDKSYVLISTAEQAAGRLPFPDPQLSFAEMAELSKHPGEAAKRLAGLLESVISAPATPKRRKRSRKKE